VTIRRSLLISVLILNLVTLGLLIGLLHLGASYAISSLATSLINETQAKIQLQVQSLFINVEEELRRISYWVDQGIVNLDDPSEINNLLKPTFLMQDQISAVIIANEQGREHMLIKMSDGWQMRQTLGPVENHQYHYTRWINGQDQPQNFDEELQYNPVNRPWFIGAMQRRNKLIDPLKVELGSQLIHWTTPYRFYSTNQPGITASISVKDRQGKVHVIAIDLTLLNISQHTTQMKVGTRGMVMVLSGVDKTMQTDVSVIGLPQSGKFVTAKDYEDNLLKRPEDLQIKVVSDAIQTLKDKPELRNKSIRFKSGSEAWWGTGTLSPLGDGLHIAVAILVPESDIMGELQWAQIAILLIAALVLAGSIYHVFKLARRFSQPVECLVQDMKRVSRGVLDEPCRVQSDVREFRSLAGAHENMRKSLQSLLKLERDMQFARQIQQKTFPSVLPQISGFEIDAWSQPADETGGDTYDIIGIRVHGDELHICDDNPDKVLFLLADATGHGIGPALSVTQLRAMMRMSVWSNVLDINTIQHINEQLMRDLPEGRFVTAWLGSLDVANHQLMSFSAGQAPMLHYQPATDTFVVLDADTPPLGVMQPLPIENRNLIKLEKGELFIVFSDGIYEAMKTGGEMFGLQRVQQVIRENHTLGAAAISEAIKKAVAEFAQGCKTKDDQTAVILKRV
jgi:serine phosphatase RsbU (regulator of sigma subunit)